MQLGPEAVVYKNLSIQLRSVCVCRIAAALLSAVLLAGKYSDILHKSSPEVPDKYAGKAGRLKLSLPGG